MRILDAGCSTGHYVDYLNQNNFQAFGLDLLWDDNWLKQIVNTKVVGNIESFPYLSESFDTVTVFEVLEHIPNIGQALREINRVCKGNIIVSVPDCEFPNEILFSNLV